MDQNIYFHFTAEMAAVGEEEAGIGIRISREGGFINSRGQRRPRFHTHVGGYSHRFNSPGK